jgi:hypothetical protein
MQQRVELRRSFKEVLEYLRKLDRHHTKVKILTEEEVEHYSISIDFAMDEICDTINNQLAEFGVIELPKEQMHDQTRSGTTAKDIN